MTSSFIPRRIVVAGHPKLSDSLQRAGEISAYLKSKGVESAHGSLYDAGLRKRVHSGDFDMLVAVGGDGTMLRAGHLCAPHGLPVMGINMGRLGFLYQNDAGDAFQMVDRLLEGDSWLEKRMMLRADHIRSGETLASWPALNDVVTCRGQLLRPIHIKASVDEQYLTTYVADGLIAATATGSTAYALASGGPILPPELRNILVIPIAPHLSVDRGVVLSEGSMVSMTVLSENAVCSVDGQIPVGLAEEDRVDVHAGEYDVQFVRFGDLGYFYRNLTAHMNQNATIGLPR